jgi:FHA domain-containing protein
MITITVISYDNEIPASAVSATFGNEGKTLGRSKDNYLVLEDPKNHVPLTQALVKSDGMRHTIVNLSYANPVLVNGGEIGTNRECNLNAGDEIQIGLYLLRAESDDHGCESTNNTDLPADSLVETAPVKRDSILSSDRTATGKASVANSARWASPAGQRQTTHWPSRTSRVSDADLPETSASHQALIQAFLNGAGIPDLTLFQGLTPEFMEMIGKLLAVSVQGSMDLSALRAMVRREANADVTMVVVRNNNPLKFLPDSQTVLMQMLRKKMPGFMSPSEAMEDTYEDLHAHQLGMVAGMRAAMDDLLERLNPEVLEKKSQTEIVS